MGGHRTPRSSTKTVKIKPPLLSDGQPSMMPKKEQLEPSPDGFFENPLIDNPDGASEDAVTVVQQVSTWKQFVATHLGAARRMLEDGDLEVTANHRNAVGKLYELCKQHKCISNAFETKEMREERIRLRTPPEVAIKSKEKEGVRYQYDEPVSKADWFRIVNNVVYRKDLYLLGHPNAWFRSGPEMLPHFTWLEYSKHVCPNRATTSREWASRDYGVCPCEYCVDWVKRFTATFFTPLRCPVEFEQVGCKIHVTYDRTGQPGLFRRGEMVWMRFQITKKGEFRVATRPDPVKNNSAGTSASGDSVARKLGWLWPAEVVGRKRQDFYSGDLATQTGIHSGDRVKEEEIMDEDKENRKTYKPHLITYTVKLIVPREADRILNIQPRTFADVLPGSLLPFIEPSKDEIKKLPKRNLDEVRELAIRDANRYTSQWKCISEHGVSFGPEILRTGDVVRLKNSQKPLALRIENFVFNDDEPSAATEFSVEGRIYSMNEDFCVRIPGFCESHATRVAAWLPVTRKAEKIPMTEIAGRLYPVKHPAFEAKHYLASAVWQDWRNAVPMGAAIEITGMREDAGARSVSRRQMLKELGDSDIVLGGIDPQDWYYVSDLNEHQEALAGWGLTEASKFLIKKRKVDEEDGKATKRRKLSQNNEDI
ncbi:hypothetical protein HDU96_003204 [Phlyctochytrium bullatum]|nr:hypothetical protein HDU96_003204 [Phlyctochytrium bullatum]